MKFRTYVSVIPLAVASAATTMVVGTAVSAQATTPDPKYWNCSWLTCMTTPAAVAAGRSVPFVVPYGGGHMKVTLVGAPGQSNTAASGGRGAVATSYLEIQPGQTLYANIGTTGSGTQTGFNGGGAGGNAVGAIPAGAGGGATDLRNAAGNRIAVAAGGGGAGGTSASTVGIPGGDAGSGGKPPPLGGSCFRAFAVRGWSNRSGIHGGPGGPAYGQNANDGSAGTDTAGGTGGNGPANVGLVRGAGGGGGGGGFGAGGGGGGGGSDPAEGSAENPDLDCPFGGSGAGGQSLVSDNGTVRLATAGETPKVVIVFSFTSPPNDGSRLVQIRQKSSKQRCATAPDPTSPSGWFGQPATLGDCAGLALSQIFRMVHESGQALNVYRFQSYEICNGGYGDSGWLDTANAFKDSGTDVVLGNYERGNTSHQLWNVNFNPDGTVGIQQVSSLRYLDSAYASTDVGTHLVIGDATGAESQQWELTDYLS